MASPSPVPCGLVEKNGSSTRFSISGAIPGPSSSTSTHTSSSEPVRSVIVPGPVIASTAFMTRFTIALTSSDGRTSMRGVAESSRRSVTSPCWRSRGMQICSASSAIWFGSVGSAG